MTEKTKEAQNTAPKEVPKEKTDTLNNGVPKEKTDTLKNDKEIVVPGEELVKSMDYVPGKNCFREGDSILSKKLGMVHINNRVISVIPLSGAYLPRTGDMVIGKVEDIQSNGWLIDVRAPYQAFLPLSGVKEFIDTNKTLLSSVFGPGDYIYTKINSASGDSIHLSMQDNMCRKFNNGQIIKIGSVKVPRLIGKQGSMINLIKNKTGCRINAGQNGFIWIEGENEDMAKKAIKMIDKESHISGLTDKISALLEGKKEK
ncbi:MAG: exosome complex RNA-binding protein Rrp4 [Nanoarchaeota archaeon]